MFEKPFGSEARDLLKRARLLKLMRGTADNGERFLPHEHLVSLLVYVERGFILFPNDEEGWRFDAPERVAS